ncbi:MAG TPA: SDR family NAD(P)-dependent oxidoreductase [Micromonosporaceae bacterium]|nr:SDR family NAD(P)-dependent oxidoreductase [Micromonosporaceae bacterium]
MVITGATSGIGLAAAVQLAQSGAEVVLIGRNAARLTTAAEKVQQGGSVRPAVFRADFAVLDEVRHVAAELRAAYNRIDVLVNNAGALQRHAVTTVDGHELTMQANHLAPFLLTNLLRDRLDRVVNTASDAHRAGVLNPDDLDAELRNYRPFRAYGTSKQANILFTVEAARRWPELLSTAFHPGLVRSRFATEYPLVALGMKVARFLRSPERGADTLVWLTQTDPAALVNGGYYRDRKLRAPRPKAVDPALAARLWASSERAVGLA